MDATLGLGGHASLVAEQLTTGRLIGLDRDPAALEACAKRLGAYQGRIELIHGDYRHMEMLLRDRQIESVDGVLFDLGVSSPQFDDPTRGFSYRFDTKLDMRMNPDDALSAYEIVNFWPVPELRRILFEYGEESYAPLIASAIRKNRDMAPIETTGQLADIITSALPPAARRKKGHPAKQSFQAIRMAVNDELAGITAGIAAAVRMLAPGGRLAVISFHSLEDKVVKRSLAAQAEGCICPPSFPMCVCGKTPTVTLITKKPVVASPDELQNNRRAHSAKLRVAEKR